MVLILKLITEKVSFLYSYVLNTERINILLNNIILGIHNLDIFCEKAYLYNIVSYHSTPRPKYQYRS